MTSPRVFFFGIDCAAPDLITRWSGEGLLPNFRSLFERGTSARAALPPLLGSGTMWTSIYTGTTPGTHGRYFYRQFDPRTYKAEDFRPTDVKATPFWSQLAGKGVVPIVIDFPVAPVCEGLPGVQIRDWGTCDPPYPDARTWPRELAGSITAEFGVDPVEPCDAPDRTAEQFQDFRDRMLRRIETKTDLILRFLERPDWDLYLAVYADGHCVGHNCWHLHDPGHPRHDPEYRRLHGDPVQDVYRALDRALGRILERLPADTTVFTYTGTGFGPDHTANHLLDELLRRMDDTPPTPRIRALDALKKVYRACVAKELRLRLTPLADRVEEGASWRERRARRFFAVPHNDIGGAIRINVRGREAGGVVAPGDEFERCCRELTQRLLELVNLETGRPAVERVVRTAEVYPGVNQGLLPDLLVGWSREARLERLGSARTGTVEGAHGTSRTGDHVSDGLLLVRGPGIPAGHRLTDLVAVEDLAPTIAAVLGKTLTGIDGKPVGELCPDRT